MKRKEEESNEINDVQQKLNDISMAFDKMENGFDRLANVAEKVSESCIKRVINRPFFLQPSFWTAFIAVSGIIGLLLTWQQQVKAVEIGNIQKQIAVIENFKNKENKQITKARILIINQTLDCPVLNTNQIRAMQQARNSSIINIITFGSNLKITGNRQAKSILAKLIQKIYFIKPKKICQINANDFDDQLRSLQGQLNNIINGKIKMEQWELKRLESSLFN